jgi:recombination DNA repair RAD52 pathway protein
MSNNNLYSQLSEQFPQEMERSINKGGVNLTYIPISEVINRLNKVLGVDMWSFTIVRCERDAVDSDFVVAHVRIEYWAKSPGTPDAHGRLITRDGFGGQKIKRNKQGQILDLGDEFKGAISDALKKAAQAFGVGLYLARSEDALEIEQVIDATPTATAYSVQVKELFESLDDSTKKQVKAFWADYSGGSKKKLSEMSDEELSVINAEIVRIKFGGSIVDTAN